MQPGVKLIICGMAVAFASFLAGCNEDPTASTPPLPKVTISKPIVKDNEVDYDEYNGWLVAKNPVEVRSRVRGFVKEIHFKNPPAGRAGEGEIIKKGDPLFDLEPDPFMDEIVQAQQKVKVFTAQKVAADKEL